MQHVACMRVDSSRKERVTISLTTIIIIIIITTTTIIIIRRHPVISLRYESGFTNSLKAKVTGEQMRPRAHVENMIFSRGGKGEGKGSQIIKRSARLSRSEGWTGWLERSIDSRVQQFYSH